MNIKATVIFFFAYLIFPQSAFSVLPDGIYQGIAPTSEEMLGHGEIKWTVQDSKVNVELATGTEIKRYQLDLSDMEETDSDPSISDTDIENFTAETVKGYAREIASHLADELAQQFHGKFSKNFAQKVAKKVGNKIADEISSQLENQPQNRLIRCFRSRNKNNCFWITWYKATGPGKPVVKYWDRAMASAQYPTYLWCPEQVRSGEYLRALLEIERRTSGDPTQISIPRLFLKGTTQPENFSLCSILESLSLETQVNSSPEQDYSVNLEAI